MAGLHKVVFRWPRTDASDVIVTGTFDGWSRSTHLIKTPSGFEASVSVPWSKKTTYKFIVDGRWATADSQPSEYDAIGNLNNVYLAPPPPETAPSAAGAMQTAADAVADVADTAKHTAVAMVEAIAPGTTEQASPAPAVPAPAPSTEPTTPAPAVPVPAPAPGSEPTTPPSLTLSSSAVIPPAEEAAPHLAPRVPVHLLPLLPPADRKSVV